MNTVTVDDVRRLNSLTGAILPQPILMPIADVRDGDVILDLHSDSLVTQQVAERMTGCADILEFRVFQRAHFSDGHVSSGAKAPAFYGRKSVVLVWPKALVR